MADAPQRAGEQDLCRGARRADPPGPGERVGSTITPLIVFREERPWLVTGTPGGGYIIATMVPLLSNVIDHRLNVAEAAERPRINQGGGDALIAEAAAGIRRAPAPPRFLDSGRCRSTTIR
ncbi:gamma-glutamyltransferase [Sphingomonas adhaesiva]|uniref:gamma-glutamyltransferase n=1 Tax=Sphingomonas adhaesiva TaxID=28212 RepID=UPI002FFB984B